MPVPGHPYSEKVFPDVQREPPVFQFVPVASCLVTEKSLALSSFRLPFRRYTPRHAHM